MLVTHKLGELPLFFMARRLGSGLILTTDYIAEPIRVWSLLMLSILQTQVLMCFKPGYILLSKHWSMRGHGCFAGAF